MGFRRPLKYKFITCLFLGWGFLILKIQILYNPSHHPLSPYGRGNRFLSEHKVADTVARSFNIMFDIYLISGINPKHSNLLLSVPSSVWRGKARMGVAL